MGHTTDFLGHIDIYPPLNEAEQMYLAAFSRSRRFARDGGPYDVPGNPVAEDLDHSAIDVGQYNTPAEAQPGLRCDWEPCWDGCCLSYNGNEKFYGATRWLTYLVEHFLCPGAYAQDSGLDCFKEFTFDHHVEGVVVGCRRDNKELFAIRVDDGDVREETLRAADSRYLDYDPLPYEEAIDRSESVRTTRRRKLRSI